MQALRNVWAYQPPPPPPPPPPPELPLPPLPEDEPGGVDAEDMAEEKLFPTPEVIICGENPEIPAAGPAYQEGL